jgi:hypothetical protein
MSIITRFEICSNANSEFTMSRLSSTRKKNQTFAPSGATILGGGTSNFDLPGLGHQLLVGTMRLKPGERDRLGRIPSAHAPASAQ